MSGTEAALLPIITANDEGEAVYLCAVCKKGFSIEPLARQCAVSDDVIYGEAVPVLYGR